MNYEENIEHQLRMLDATWQAFEKNGVTPETQLVLDFAYVSPDQSAAVSLNDVLENYESRVRSEGFLNEILGGIIYNY